MVSFGTEYAKAVDTSDRIKEKRNTNPANFFFKAHTSSTYDFTLRGVKIQ
jgi:hypothetical protein